MRTLNELKQRQADLEAEVKQVVKNERADALKEVRRLCKLHGFTYNQFKGHLAPGRNSRPVQ